MMNAVSCPKCQGWSRVRADAIGQAVTCPYCMFIFKPTTTTTEKPAAQFAPAPTSPTMTERVPVVYSTGTRRPKPMDELPSYVEPEFDIPAEPSPAPTPLLLALCLIPVGIPLVWWSARFFAPAVVPVFSFAAPTALAVCLLGLCLGVAHAAGWSLGTRMRAVVMLVALGYGTAGFLYFLKKEWAEAVRQRVGPPEPLWKEFKPPDNAYSISMPGRPTPADGNEFAIPGWALSCFRSGNSAKGDGTGVFAISYTVAAGKPPKEVPDDAVDDEWFDAAKKSIRDAVGGKVTQEKVVLQQNYPGREYVITLPDGGTTRIVRVFRARRSAFYLAVEGAFLTTETKNVRTFFDKFIIAANTR